MAQSSEFKSVEFLTHLIRGMAQGLIFIDREKVVRLCNPVGAKIMGVKPEKLLGKNFLNCHPKYVHEKVLSVVESLRTGKSLEEKRIVTIGERLYEHSYAPVKDLKGNFLGIVSVSKDVTERERLQREIEEHTKNLEQSNRLKDLFSDILGHDLINPASIIKNFSEMLLEDKELDAETRQDLKTIKRNIERIIEMIENTKKFSKLEGIEALSLEGQDLGEVLRKTSDEFMPFITSKGLKLSLEFDGRYPAHVSPLIDDVFSNLVSNAIKYSPDSSQISININENDKAFVVSVADHAEKIPDEQKKAIFERFQRVKKGGVKGSGLGLAIVKRIMELHKGSAWVEDNPDGGNIFYVKIPKKN